MDCTVTNANYQRVITVIEKLARTGEGDLCSCKHCVNDIAALALNYLPPHYYVDHDHAKDLGSPWLMVEAAVREAIEIVKELHLRHG